MNWSRPNGPPKVWRVADIVNKDGKNMRFSFQEIPEDRYTEAVEHMCTFFLRDEPLNSSIKLIEEPESVDIYRQTVITYLRQGISVAAYEHVNDNRQPILAGVNILYIAKDGEKRNIIINEKATRRNLIHSFLARFREETDIHKLYNVDRYLSALGLMVHPRYRGLGLGQHLLEIRDHIGKAYDIPLTGTLFTSAIAQKLAKRVGFEDCNVHDISDIVDDKGEAMFPLLKGKQVKLMVKRL